MECPVTGKFETMLYLSDLRTEKGQKSYNKPIKYFDENEGKATLK